jgi:hypothetical protein
MSSSAASPTFASGALASFSTPAATSAAVSLGALASLVALGLAGPVLLLAIGVEGYFATFPRLAELVLVLLVRGESNGCGDALIVDHRYHPLNQSLVRLVDGLRPR